MTQAAHSVCQFAGVACCEDCPEYATARDRREAEDPVEAPGPGELIAAALRLEMEPREYFRRDYAGTAPLLAVVVREAAMRWREGRERGVPEFVLALTYRPQLLVAYSVLALIEDPVCESCGDGVFLSLSGPWGHISNPRPDDPSWHHAAPTVRAATDPSTGGVPFQHPTPPASNEGT